jgi:quercetin dioxygenase-like cupin family protein
MLTAGKVWGTTSLLFRNEMVEVHYLEISMGGFSSEHRHQFKANIFHVLSGEIICRVWQPTGKKDETRISAGGQAVISPGVFHQFEAVADSRVIEIYVAGLGDGPDIDRRTEGGKRCAAEMKSHKRSSE